MPRRSMTRYGRSSTGTGGGTPNPVSYGPLLDQTDVPSGLFFALGLRLLRAAYTGNCLKVQRSSDNATQDIGFNGDGSLNTAAIATFCGSSPGFVNTWYDQSGSGANFVARTVANTTAMYRIYTGTAIETVSTLSSTATAQRPCIRAVNTSSDLVSSAFTAHTANFASFSVVGAIENTVTSINGRMFGLFGATNTDSSDNAGMNVVRSGSSSPTAAWIFQRNPASSGPAITVADAYSQLSQVDVVANGASYSFTVDSGTPGTSTNTAQNFNFTNGAIGWSGNTHASVGELTEVVAGNTAWTSANLTAIRINQSGYWNTAAAPSDPTGGTGGGGTGTGGGSGATNLPGWTLAMDEGFDTIAAEGQFLTKYTNFAAYANGTLDTWGQAHGGGSQYRTDNVSVANSICTVRIYANSSGSYGAALLPKWPGKAAYTGYTNFRKEIRARCLSPVNWQKIADLFWPDSNSWNDGEIDFPEGNLNGTVGGFNHWPGNPTSQDSYSGSTTFAAWHSYVVEKTSTSLKFIIDGTVVKTITTHLNTTPMHSTVQIERILSSTPAPVAGTSCNFDIDYIRLWLPA